MRGTAAGLLALVVFLVYRATLLPDFDLGDTASFQTMGGEPMITPRDGYPLYYALGQLIVLCFDNHAYAMNLLSALAGALACGVLLLVAVELCGSLLAALAAAVLFAASYTFWSQAVIAEVYTLHVLLIGLTLLLLLRWSRAPTTGRLAAFFAVYALAFGNHLSMILLLPAYTFFLLVAAPEGWRSMLSARVVLMAAALAAAGLAQYAWNFSAIWHGEESLVETLQTFWFDVTKSDWRETMVLEVPTVLAGERARMYYFDVLQQFGAVPVAFAAAGLVRLAAVDWRRAVLLLLIFVSFVAFALGYNVGDPHVFFLGSHLVMALLFASGIVAAQLTLPNAVRSSIALAGIALASWNLYQNYPALDRSRDVRPMEVLRSFTNGLHEQNALLLSDLNWQLQNGLTYFGQHVRPELLHTRLADVFLYAPVFVRDNLAIGRQVMATERAARLLEGGYGPLFTIKPDAAQVMLPSLEEVVRQLPPGSRYVLSVLKPTREFPLDGDRLESVLQHLSGGGSSSLGEEDYIVIAGRAGTTPELVQRANRPFKSRVMLDGVTVDIRMESWLAFDTIRRMGFGQVIANRHHALIVERGVSFVALDDDGRPLRTAYASGIYAPQPRYLVLSSK